MKRLNDNIRSPINIRYITCRNGGEDYFVPEHKVTTYEWFYIISGSMEQTIDGKKYILEANDSLLITPGVMRSPKIYKTEPTYICAVFYLDDIDLSRLLLKLINIPTDLLPAVRALADELESPGGGDTVLYQHSLLFYILLGLLRVNDQNTVELPSSQCVSHSVVVTKKVLAYMHANLQRPLTRDDFADVVKLSVSQVSRIFKTITGKSLNAALTDIRIERAQFLLTASTLPITQIGYEVGFNSFSHFTQMFKRHVGLSPSEYRKKTAVFK